MIALSGPAAFCRSPIASINASFALARAMAIASPCPVDLSEMLESDSNPTAVTVSRIIMVKVTMRAKPRGGIFRDIRFILAVRDGRTGFRRWAGFILWQ
ncbi:hypothetical protein [Luteolibacter yonseiensis]|uniref:hypothetical protein n=1 Tax=Luteolibacter yonseiensis TaxID=1144680 RepID=UPI0031E8AB67